MGGVTVLVCHTVYNFNYVELWSQEEYMISKIKQLYLLKTKAMLSDLLTSATPKVKKRKYGKAQTDMNTLSDEDLMDGFLEAKAQSGTILD